MADAINTTRRGFFKAIPAAAIAGIVPLDAQAATKTDPAAALLASIATPEGASGLAVTVKHRSGAHLIEASCVSAAGALLFLNPRTGAWA